MTRKAGPAGQSVVAVKSAVAQPAVDQSDSQQLPVAAVLAAGTQSPPVLRSAVAQPAVVTQSAVEQLNQLMYSRCQGCPKAVQQVWCCFLKINF